MGSVSFLRQPNQIKTHHLLLLIVFLWFWWNLICWIDRVDSTLSMCLENTFCGAWSCECSDTCKYFLILHLFSPIAISITFGSLFLFLLMVSTLPRYFTFRYFLPYIYYYWLYLNLFSTLILILYFSKALICPQNLPVLTSIWYPSTKKEWIVPKSS